MTPYLISVSGFMGSGKSTLAKNLANYLSWDYLPERMQGINYLGDLFVNPEKWAFEAQISFLSDKSLQLIRRNSSNKNVILDRSLQEDIEIFAKYFYDNNHINARAWKTYHLLSDFFIKQSTIPDIILYCYCDFKTSLSRIKTRRKKNGFIHPESHLNEIFNRYRKWVKSQKTLPMYLVNSEINDFRSPKTIESIVKDLQYIFSTPSAPQQLELFPSDKNKNVYQLEVLEEKSPVTTRKNISQLKKQSATNLPMTPYAYIAAPFTAVSEYHDNDKNVPSANLFNNQKLHGKIPKGTYRNLLLQVTRTIKKYGLATFLPHKDVNQWGGRILQPQDVVELCISHVLNCDFFLGILGESHGAHYEFGLAQGRNIPAALIRCKEIKDSFILSGITSSLKNTIVFNCDKSNEIPSILKSNNFINFLNSHLELKI